MSRLLVTLPAGLLAACSDMHVFEVDATGDPPPRGSLTIYGATSGMERIGTRLIGRRRGGDGSGTIFLTYGDGRTIECPIGYVTNRDPEPHRFAVRDGRCEPND